MPLERPGPPTSGGRPDLRVWGAVADGGGRPPAAPTAPTGRSRRRLLAALLVVLPVLAFWPMRPSAGVLGIGGKATPTTLLEIPDVVSGPIASAGSGAAAEGDLDGPAMAIDAARTGADDSQLVVSFTGRTCGAYAATTAPGADVVTVTVQYVRSPVCRTTAECDDLPPTVPLAVPDPMSGRRSVPSQEFEQFCEVRPRTLGIALPQALGGRRLSDGERRLDVVDGRTLARIRFPGADERAPRESLTTALWMGSTAGVFTWLQADTTVGKTYLIQEHPLGGGLVNTRCGAPDGPNRNTTSKVDVDGDPGELLVCSSGRMVVLWVHDGDQLSLNCNPGCGSPDAFVELARSVEFGDE